MGYDTNFGGEFAIQPPLTAAQVQTLQDFNKTQHDGIAGVPGSTWCQWVPSDDGTTLVWDEQEKFYEYTQWLQYLVHHYFGPWGCTLDGEVEWNGDDVDDRGSIVAEPRAGKTVIGIREMTFVLGPTHWLTK